MENTMKYSLQKSLKMMEVVSDAANQEIEKTGLGTGITNKHTEYNYDRTEDDIILAAENIQFVMNSMHNG